MSVTRIPDSAADELRIVLRAVAILGAVVLTGTFGFYFIEADWSLWRAFYFTLITITTVGYGDDGISPASEVFAVLLLVSGIGTATWTLSTVVQFAVGCQFDPARRMKRRIQKMENHVIVCGFERLGQTLCRELRESGLEIVVLTDSSESLAEAIGLGFIGFQGDPTDELALIDAGIERARGVVCCMETDAENILATLTARDMNSDAFIATLAENESAASRFQRAGATHVVSPYTTAGVDIARAILRPHLTELLKDAHRSTGDFAMSEIRVEPGSRLAQETPESFGGVEESIAFIAVRREGGELIYRPSGTERFLGNDIIIAAGQTDAMARMAKAAHTRASTVEPRVPEVVPAMA